MVQSESSALGCSRKNRRRSSTDGSYSDSLLNAVFVRLVSNIHTKRLSGRRIADRFFSFSSSASAHQDRVSERIIVFPGLCVNCSGNCERNKLHLACCLSNVCPERKYRKLLWSMYTVTG